jgi:hypothetical protein
MLHAAKIINLVIRRTSLACGILLAAVIALQPSSVEAQCSTGWDASGRWSISQRGQKERIKLDLQQNGRVLTGTASIEHEETPWTGGITTQTVRARVDGTIDGDNFSVQIFWERNLTGVYNAKVLPSGRLDGETYDKNNSKIRQTWNSWEVLKCLPPPSTPAKPKPIKATGKRKVMPPPVQTSQPAPPPMKVPGIIASPTIFPHPTAVTGFVILQWDAGSEHPYAEVWFKINGGEPTFLVEKGKGDWRVDVQRGFSYTYTLTDAGKTLAEVSFVAQ